MLVQVLLNHELRKIMVLSNVSYQQRCDLCDLYDLYVEESSQRAAVVLVRSSDDARTGRHVMVPRKA